MAVALCILGTLPVQAQPRAATVTILVVDPFGVAQNDCRVTMFKAVDPTGQIDYARRFAGLSASGIPFGPQYKVEVACRGGYRDSQWTPIERPEAFLVMWIRRHRGDYHTGLGPRLTVDYRSTQTGETPRWAKLSGVYTSESEIARLDPASGRAEFYSLMPGRYALDILGAGETFCSAQIDLLVAGAAISLNGDCSARVSKSARVIKPVDRKNEVRSALLRRLVRQLKDRRRPTPSGKVQEER